MNNENALQIGFWALLGLMILMRIWFAARVLRAGERLRPDRAAVRREGWDICAIRILVTPLLITLIVLLARNPTWWPKLNLRCLCLLELPSKAA